MKRLLSLLYSGQLKRWREQVSMALDAIVASGSAALAETQFLQAATSGNVVVALNTDVVLDTVTEQRGIAYNPATGVATLTGGRTYSLRAGGSISNMIGGAPDFLDITWVDAATNTELQPTVVGTWIPVSDVSTTAPSNAVEVLYSPPSDQTVKLRVIGSGGGGGIVPDGHFWTVIEQIG